MAGHTHRRAGCRTRRGVLVAGLSVGLSALAGCVGNDDRREDSGVPWRDEADRLPAAEADDRSRLHVQVPWNPELAHYLWDLDVGVDAIGYAPGVVYAATHEPGLWGRWYDPGYWSAPGETHLGLYEDCEISPGRLAVTIREGARWSDGEPVTAFDVKAAFAFWRLPPDGAEIEDVWQPAPEAAGPFGVRGATAEVRMPDGPGGRRIEFHAREDGGWEVVDGYAAFPEGRLLSELGGPAPRMGVRFPAHVEPYRVVAEEAIENWEARYENPPTRAELAAAHVTEAHLKSSREPENFVSTGPWTLELATDDGVLLRPNEHSRHAGAGFEAVVIEAADPPPTWWGIQDGRYDYVRTNAPEPVVEGFPDRIEEVLSPSPTGYAIALDYAGPLGEAAVRRALLYALDTETIAANVHPKAADAVTVPGWDAWGIEAVLDEGWAREQLLAYDHDLDAAAAAMRGAGYERIDGVWHRDGEPLELRFGADMQPPDGRFSRDDDRGIEGTAIDHLETFGVEISFTSYERTGFSTRWRGSDRAEPFDREYGGSGAFDLWAGRQPDNMVAGEYRGLGRHFSAAVASRERARARNYFDHDGQEAVLEAYDENGRIGGQYELWADWTIEIPPVGEPDGDLRPFSPGLTWELAERHPAGAAAPQPENPSYDPPRDEPHPENATHFWRTFAWTVNRFLPVLPLIKLRNQQFLDTGQWDWPTDHELWPTFGTGWDAPHLLGLGAVSAADSG